MLPLLRCKFFAISLTLSIAANQSIVLWSHEFSTRVASLASSISRLQYTLGREVMDFGERTCAQ